jgi:hypothetical protein
MPVVLLSSVSSDVFNETSASAYARTFLILGLEEGVQRDTNRIHYQTMRSLKGHNIILLPYKL